MEFISAYYSILEFLDKGGVVLYLIYAAAFLLWFLVFERFIYIYFSAKKDAANLQKDWQNYRQHHRVEAIRESLAYEFESKLIARLALIRTLVRITPLLGLFGTVYGMIEIFDVIAQQGTGDARAMANGISMATLPTMTGMAVAIIGLIFMRRIESLVHKKISQFNEGLTL